MTTSITCLACAHAANVGPGPAPSESLFVCGECNARMVYGELAPRLCVEPCRLAGGFQGIRVRVQDPITKADMHAIDLDPQHAAILAKNILSLVIP